MEAVIAFLIAVKWPITLLICLYVFTKPRQRIGIDTKNKIKEIQERMEMLRKSRNESDPNMN